MITVQSLLVVRYFDPLVRGYSGSSSTKYRQPQRGCGPSVPARAPDLGHNTVGVVPISERAPDFSGARRSRRFTVRTAPVPKQNPARSLLPRWSDINAAPRSADLRSAA